MRAVLVLCLLAIAAATWNSTYNDAPIWKVFCEPIYHGRVDSLVDPGTYSGHVHKVFGGNHFSPSKASRTPLGVYNVTRSSPCTSCSLATIDNSNYWTTDLFYQWPNGSLSLVPNSGLTIYYLSRGGDTGENRTNPNWQPIPKGLRMLAGNTLRRSTNSSDVTSNAINYVCLTNGAQAPDSNTFQTQNYFCQNGMRAQVWFPMCWDGVNLDSPNHQDHMSYPLNSGNRPDGGDCPNSHPVRIPGIFYEHFYSVSQFPHGDGKRQPFVWSNGDNNGGGLHGDFVSGWIPEVQAAAIAHPNCSNNNPLMAFGNAVNECPPLAPYVKPGGSDPNCLLLEPIPTVEALGLSTPISHLPGCNPISAGPAPQVKCAAPLNASDNTAIFQIQSVYLGTSLTADKRSSIVYSNYSGAPSLQQMWGFNIWQAGNSGAPSGMTMIQNQESTGFISAQNSAQLVYSNYGAWEFWTAHNNGTYYWFQSNRNQLYMTVNTTGNLVQFTATTVGPAELFRLVYSNGGYVPTEDGLDAFAALTPPQTLFATPTGTGATVTGSQQLSGRQSASSITVVSVAVLVAALALVF